MFMCKPEGWYLKAVMVHTGWFLLQQLLFLLTVTTRDRAKYLGTPCSRLEFPGASEEYALARPRHWLIYSVTLTSSFFSRKGGHAIGCYLTKKINWFEKNTSKNFT